MTDAVLPDPPPPDPFAVVQLYGRYRIEDQADYYSRRARLYESAARHAAWASAALLVLAATFGALGVADAAHRAAWAFGAASASAVATAISTYEAAFGFDRLSRQYRETLGVLRIAQSRLPLHGATSVPPRLTEDEVAGFVGRVEAILRSEIDTWSQLNANRGEDQRD